MTHVQRVLEILKVITLPKVRIYLDEAIEIFELRITGKLRWLPVTQECENEPQILARWKTPYIDLVTESILLWRLLDAPAIPGKFPAVIKATQFIAFDPTGRELRSAMR